MKTNKIIKSLLLGVLFVAIVGVSVFGFLELRTRLVSIPLAKAGLIKYDHSKRSVPGDISVESSGSKVATDKQGYMPREILDSSGYNWILQVVKPWPTESSLQEISTHFAGAVKRTIDSLGKFSEDPTRSPDDRSMAVYTRASFYNIEGEPGKAYEDLCKTREWVEANPALAHEFLYTVIYFQGITGLRLGENQNCILCRGESSCILPIAASAQHKKRTGSETAIKHFEEYLSAFPADGEVRWLLNVAYMTLGEYPDKVPPQHLISLDRWQKNEFDIGRFRDIGEAVGVNRLNQAGGGLMEDFNNDGRLDIVVSTFDPSGVMGLYLNDGAGKFVERTVEAGISNQLGGLNCMQTDYNNDGWMDVLIVRGAWLPKNMSIRPTLLKNNGDETFTDVTIEAGLAEPVNSIAASWADYDNDGWLDLFVCCENQPNRLYHNEQNGSFTERAFHARLTGNLMYSCKGANWLDFDNDGYQDLFLNHLSQDGARLYRNNRNGTFDDVSKNMGITGPTLGFSCWAWDYDNDGWLDIFATSYDRSVAGVVAGMTGQKHNQRNNALYRNMDGKGFEDVTEQVGLDLVLLRWGVTLVTLTTMAISISMQEQAIRV